MQTSLTLSQKVFKELDHKCKESQPIDLIYIFNVMHAEEWYVIKYRSKCKRALWVSKKKIIDGKKMVYMYNSVIFFLDIHNVKVPLIVSSFLGFSEIC